MATKVRVGGRVRSEGIVGDLALLGIDVLIISFLATANDSALAQHPARIVTAAVLFALRLPC
jgi:hypothetical protein